MKDTFKNLKQLIEQFSDENVCRQYLEKQRWNGKPRCPHCGNDAKVYKLGDGKTYKCGNKECYKKFTVTVKTIFENSNVKLSTWFAAIYIITAHKKGISSHQLARDLSVTQKTAWFLNHRIREMLKEKEPVMLGGIVEVDETYVAGKEKNKHKSTRSKRLVNGIIPKFKGDKGMVLGLLERNGKVVTHVISETNAQNIFPIIEKQVKKGSHITTDDLNIYRNMPALGYLHTYVKHGKGEYVSGESHTGTLDGYWGLLKRGIIGIYHSTSRKHLHRYCDEFSYRYNTRKTVDSERFTNALALCNGRLKYDDLIGKNDVPPNVDIETGEVFE